MASPYPLKKVPLQSSPKYSETELLRTEHLHCDSDLDLSKDDRLRFAYATWCPVCETRQLHQCGSRRGKNEGMEADPLREHNRDFELNSDVHCHKMLTKECDSCASESYDRHVQNLPRKQFLLPTPMHRSRANPFPEQHYLEVMDVDRSSERPRMRGRPKAFSVSPVKKYKEHFIPSADSYHPSYDNGSISSAQSDEYDDYPSHDVYNDDGNDMTSGSSRKGEVDLHGLSSSYRKNMLQPCSDFGQFKNGYPHIGNDLRLGSDCSSKLLNGYSHLCPDNHNDAFQQNEDLTCNLPVNMLFEHVNGASDPRSVFHTNSVGLKDRYDRDLEVLRSKLRDLRNADKKRLRQRSESEPGVNYSRNLQDCLWEAKRARDNSPHYIEFTESRQLTSSYSISSVSPNRPSGRNAKLPPLPCKQKMAAEGEEGGAARGPPPTPRACDSDFEIGEASSEEGEQREPPADDSEDDRSVPSSPTTVSSDSGRSGSGPVGDCLGSISLEDPAAAGVPDQGRLPGALRPSLFSFVPPFVRFSLHDAKGEELPSEIQRLLKWKLSAITPLVVRRTLVNSGFRLVKRSNDWCGTWGKHMKSLCFGTLQDFQKVNHFPGTFQIGRKDRLWKNMQRLMAKFGKKEFGFVPRTFVLPQEGKLLRQTWEKSGGRERWIVKPPASARGTGIRVIHRWSQIPKKRPVVVQRYISRPYLINGSKFDLRLYVLVTSIDPLRVYLYDDGLVRFASVKYSDEMSSLGDRYMHLTNYSINKLSSQYTANEDSSACQGHKWTVKTLWSYLERGGVDVPALRTSLTDLVIKTIISGESAIGQTTRASLASRYASYELFGVDVLLDDALRPWLLEVNISPSLHSSSPLDLAVKGPMVRDLMNMAGYHIPNRLVKQQQDGYLQAYGIQQRTGSLCFDRRLYTMALSRREQAKHAAILQCTSREQYLREVLEDLTPDDVRHLVQSEDELTQRGDFARVFPTTSTHAYHEFFEAPRYYNMLLDAWEAAHHGDRRGGIDLLESKCRVKFHLSGPDRGGPPKERAAAAPPEDPAPGWEDEETETERLQGDRRASTAPPRPRPPRQWGPRPRPHLVCRARPKTGPAQSPSPVAVPKRPAMETPGAAVAVTC